MKRVLALALAAALALAGGSHLTAQQPAPTRVAIVNIGLVFTKYAKADAYKRQMEKLLEPYQLEGKKLKKEMLDWTEQMKNPKFDLKDRERYEYHIKEHQRKLEDLELTVRKLIGKTQEEQIIGLFREVEDAIKRYATAQAISVVLGYGEQTDGDLYAFPNINRKMQGMDLGGLNPMFVAPGIDISQPVIDMLNANFQRNAVIPASGSVPLGTVPLKK
jgi:Skp family chaperone for outer membrane proteins